MTDRIRCPVPAAALAVPLALAAWACQSGEASGAPPHPTPDGGPGTGGDAGPGEPAPPPPCALDVDCRDRGPSLICVAGACVGDPRDRRFCGALVTCPAPLECGPAGWCVCASDEDCPPGERCGDDGACAPRRPEACAADTDCATPGVPPSLCLAGRCVAAWDEGAPTLAEGCAGQDAPHALVGTRVLSHQLPVRDVLPPAADAVLEAVAAPFRVLAGDGLTLDLGLPAWLDRLVARLAIAWAEEHLEPWHRAVLGAFGDVDAVLDTWRIEETLDLTAAPPPWAAATIGRRRTLTLAFEHGEGTVSGSPEDVLGRDLALPDPVLVAGCGRLGVRQRGVDVPLGAVLVWVLDELVDEASDGRFATSERALDHLGDRVCAGLAEEIDRAVGLGVGPVLRRACAEELADLRAAQVEALRAADLGVGPLVWAADGALDSAGDVPRGQWDGRLAGAPVEGPMTLIGD